MAERREQNKTLFGIYGNIEEKATKENRNKGNALSAVDATGMGINLNKINLMQAVVLSEVLGQCKAKKDRRRGRNLR